MRNGKAYLCLYVNSSHSISDSLFRLALPMALSYCLFIDHENINIPNINGADLGSQGGMMKSKIIYEAYTRATYETIFVRVSVANGMTEIQATGCEEIVIVPDGQAVLFEIGARSTEIPIRIRASRTETADLSDLSDD